MRLQEEYVTVEVNRGVLRHCSPLRNLLYGALFYVTVLLIAPVTLNVEYSFGAAFFVFACCIAFIVGATVIPAPAVPENNSVRYPAARIQQLVRVFLILSVICTLAKFYDSFVLRGLSLSQDVLENREAAGGGSGNPVAIVAAFFMYAPYILLVLLFSFGKYFTVLEKILVWFFFGIQCLYTFLMGGRSGILFPFVFILLTLIYFRKVKLRFNLKTAVAALVIFIIGCTCAGKIYTDRTQTLNPYAVMVEMGRISGASATVPSNDTVYDLICESEEGSLPYYFLLGYVNICQYCIHGLFEFNAQKDFADQVLPEHTGGTCTFGVYIKFFDRLFGTDYANMDKYLYSFAHPGIFNSVFGPVYTDFGWYGIIVFFFWGLIQKLIWNAVYKTGNLILLPWVFLGGMIIFLFSLVNLFYGVLCYGFTFIVIMYFLMPQKVSPEEEVSGNAALTAVEVAPAD